MKQLILMRHAKAQAKAASGEDFDRDLEPRGLEEAVIVARALEAHGVRPDLALVSAANRTSQTFRQVESVLGNIPVTYSEDLYNAETAVIQRMIEAHEDQAQCLLVIGHNPGIQFLSVDYMISGAAGLGAIDKVRGNFATATAVLFEVDVAGRPIYDGVYFAKS